MGPLIWVSDPEGGAFSCGSSVDQDPIRGYTLSNGFGGIGPSNYAQEFPIIGSGGSEPIKNTGN